MHKRIFKIQILILIKKKEKPIWKLGEKRNKLKKKHKIKPYTKILIQIIIFIFRDERMVRKLKLADV